jgi:hypothetical protein
MKHSIIGGDLNLPQVDWEGVAEGNSVTQTFINRLVWYNGYTQLVSKPTRGYSLLDVYLIRLLCLLYMFLCLLYMFCSVYSVYCLYINVSCIAATGCQTNCS